MGKMAPWFQRLWDEVWSECMGDDEESIPTNDQFLQMQRSLMKKAQEFLEKKQEDKPL
jgi:hypothetical protein